MAKKSKRIKEVYEMVDSKKIYAIEEAIEILKKVPHCKFDESVEVAITLNVDPKNTAQTVRGAVVLPNGTGKKVKVLVFCKGELEAQAKEAGADLFGGEELVAKVAGGFLDFDAVVSTPDMMKDVGKLGKVLGPRGMMPNPKVGTVTNDVAKAVNELKGGKVEYKMSKLANIHCIVGKLSFDSKKIAENIDTLVKAIYSAKPSGVKGHFFKTFAMSSTMGPGIKLEIPRI